MPRTGPTLSATADAETGDTHAPFRTHRPEMVILFMQIGLTGLSSLVFTFEIAVATSMPDVILPNTGCLEGPGENQSRFLLFATLMKNCEPPVLGLPVLAIDSVPGALVSREMFSSLMLPPPVR